MEHVEKQPDFVWEIDCTTSSNVQRARNRHKRNGKNFIFDHKTNQQNKPNSLPQQKD